ncbi:MAG TPA: hypothetical protein VFT37_07800 [Telluria sp.]|nr:hypothetical protein [Telluria sp.]
MKTLTIAIALTLLKRAESRAAMIMNSLAAQRAMQDEAYAANAGGWN